MKTKNQANDAFALFRHTTFKYLGFYLSDFFQSHSITRSEVKAEAGFGGSTLEDMLCGKDMHLNCYLRLLITLGAYCKDTEEFKTLIDGFMRRAIVEIWIMWELTPEDWMEGTWIIMEKEKDKFTTKSNDNTK